MKVNRETLNSLNQKTILRRREAALTFSRNGYRAIKLIDKALVSAAKRGLFNVTVDLAALGVGDVGERLAEYYRVKRDLSCEVREFVLLLHFGGIDVNNRKR